MEFNIRNTSICSTIIYFYYYCAGSYYTPPPTAQDFSRDVVFVGFSFSATSSVSDHLHLLQHYNACSGSGAVTFSHATLQHLLHNLCSDWQASINLARLCSIIISPAIQLDSTQQGSWHCEASQRKFPLSWQGGSLLLQ